MTSQHEIALMRLVAQRVVGPACASPEDAVGHLLAVQAQDLPGAMTSIALRTASRAIDDVRAAFDEARVVRTWPMRGTLHALRAADVRWTVELMTPRPRAAMAKRRADLGITDADVELAHERAVTTLTGGGAATRAELLAVWQEAGLETTGGHGYHLLAHLAHVGVLCLGPMRAKDQAFVLVDEWVPDARRLERDEAIAELALRFLRSHGPATVTDLVRWSGLPAGDVRTGVAVAAAELETLEVDGTTYHLDPAVPELLARHRDDARGLHLLPGFDEMVLGYADRTATVPAEHADRIVPGGNGVFRRTVLHDGVAVATWRPGRRRSDPEVEVDPFTTLPAGVAAAIPDRVAALPSA